MSSRQNRLREDNQLNGQQVNIKSFKPAPVGDDPSADYDAALEEINAKKRELAQANQETEKQMTDLVAAEKLAYAKKQEARKREKADYRTLAKHYRDLAADQADRAQADELLRWAIECDELARQIIIEGETEPAANIEKAAERLPWWERERELMAIGIVLFTSLLIWAMSEYFQMFREMIIEQNQALPPEQQMVPYDRTSMQKFIYEKWVQATDLPVALLMMFLVMPPVAFYVLPFARSKPDFWTDFKSLTPAYRCTIATCFVLGFLLLAVLAHLVKS
ncbi:hypothetical protein [Fibrella aquatica]|uniref:hypothetical protein n=1 Tax=Fibrella aquatica TaxID=3242487 RepID=UPI0035218873